MTTVKARNIQVGPAVKEREHATGSLLFLSTGKFQSHGQLLDKLTSLGCEESVVGLVLPTGYAFNHDGTCLYFASQGAGRLFWPLTCGFIRVFIAIVGGWAVLRLNGSLNSMFAALAGGLVVYGISVAAIIGSGAWFRN